MPPASTSQFELPKCEKIVRLQHEVRAENYPFAKYDRDTVQMCSSQQNHFAEEVYHKNRRSMAKVV
jgi:hypothetical protein